jgi:hypothetical protein
MNKPAGFATLLIGCCEKRSKPLDSGNRKAMTALSILPTLGGGSSNGRLGDYPLTLCNHYISFATHRPVFRRCTSMSAESSQHPKCTELGLL